MTLQYQRLKDKQTVVVDTYLDGGLHARSTKKRVVYRDKAGDYYINWNQTKYRVAQVGEGFHFIVHTRSVAKRTLSEALT